MASIFTKIVQGEIPSYKIAETDRYYAFLDIRPLTKGHTLVIPKEEIDYLFDLDDKVLSGLMLFAKKVAAAMEKTVTCKRVGLMVLGMEVPHAHVHLVPLNKEGDMSLANTPLQLSQEEMSDLADAIRANYSD
jgi:histidine triad (HIT) family protein